MKIIQTSTDSDAQTYWSDLVTLMTLFVVSCQLHMHLGNPKKQKDEYCMVSAVGLS